MTHSLLRIYISPVQGHVQVVNTEELIFEKLNKTSPSNMTSGVQKEWNIHRHHA